MFTPELIGIFLYLALQLAFGLMVSRSIKTQDDYLLAGRQVGPVLGLFSIFATWFGAGRLHRWRLLRLVGKVARTTGRLRDPRCMTKRARGRALRRAREEER